MKNLKKLMALLLCAAMLVGAAAGCNKTEDTSTDKSTATQTPATQTQSPAENLATDAGDGNVTKDELRIAMNGEMGSLDPLTNWDVASYFIYWTVYNRLTRYDMATGTYQPELAESWDVADDGLSYTFHLRNDVKWHDGTPFTAKDVVYTVAQGIELGTGNYPGVDHAEALDDYTVKVVMKEVNSVFLDKQWTGDCCIVKDGSTTEDRARNPMGTGTYKFVEWVSGDHITIEAFDGYWGEKSGNKKITFSIIPEANARLVALQSGDIDIANVDAAAIDHVTSDENLVLLSTDSIFVKYLSFNCTDDIFSKEKVRQACCWAIDRETLIVGQLDGQGNVARSVVAAEKMGFYDGWDNDYEVDVEKAKGLLTEAGYPDGFECTLMMTSADALAAQLIQADLAKIGVTVNLVETESAAKADLEKNGDYQLSICGRSAGAADAYLNMYMSGRSGNKPLYANEEYDELLQKSWVELDLEARNEIYKEMQIHLHEHAPSFPLWTGKILLAANKNVKALTADSEGCHDFRTAYMGN